MLVDQTVTLTQNQFGWLVIAAFLGVTVLAMELGMMLGHLTWELEKRWRRRKEMR
jgi:hypothetical protein